MNSLVTISYMGQRNSSSFFRNNEWDSVHLTEGSNLSQLLTDKVKTNSEKVPFYIKMFKGNLDYNVTSAIKVLNHRVWKVVL